MRTQYETDVDRIREAIKSRTDVIYYEKVKGDWQMRQGTMPSEDCEDITCLVVCHEKETSVEQLKML